MGAGSNDPEAVRDRKGGRDHRKSDEADENQDQQAALGDGENVLRNQDTDQEPTSNGQQGGAENHGIASNVTPPSSPGRTDHDWRMARVRRTEMGVTDPGSAPQTAMARDARAVTSSPSVAHPTLPHSAAPGSRSHKPRVSPAKTSATAVMRTRP